MNSSISKAIQNRQIIELDYPPGKRIIEPHAYGESSEGNGLLRAYQTSGASASGEHVNWKLFRVDRINSVRVLDKTFPGPRPDYHQNDKAMKGGIFAQL